MTQGAQQKSYADYWQPRYWLIWAGAACAWLITRLPYPLQLRIGALIGRVALRLAKSRRRIVEVNIALCFPSLSPAEQARLVRGIFRATGISVIETANAWLRDPHDFLDRVTFSGLDHLKTARDEGRGVLLVGFHFTTLDLCGAILSTQVDYDIMYRRNRNPLVNLIMERSRRRNFPNSFDRKDIRSIVASLRAGHVLWYGPDQDYGRRHSVFAPFFEVPAATITATARFARISGAPILLYTHFREEDGTYRMEISPPLTGYPTGDEVADATSLNQRVEAAIRQKPEQYWWVHRRFKTRPEGEARPY